MAKHFKMYVSLDDVVDIQLSTSASMYDGWIQLHLVQGELFFQHPHIVIDRLY